MKAIDNKELILALEDLEKEKGIKKEYLLESIETALVTAYKRNFDAQENVKIEMDKQTGATHVYSVKEMVEEPENSIITNELLDWSKLIDWVYVVAVAVFPPPNPVPPLKQYTELLLVFAVSTILINGAKLSVPANTA